MHISKIEHLIKQGEGLRVEFKACSTVLNKNIYETICAFLNRSGGELLLGISDKGEITGIDAQFIQHIKNDFTTTINNPQKINPPFYLSVEEILIEKKKVLYIYVPESSQVHRCNGKIFDRNEDGDFNITDNHSLVSALFLRKQTAYSENKIYPYVELVDLRVDVIAQVRKLALLQRNNHSWSTMDDVELLQSAQVHKKDIQTGLTGFTLAGILLFGKDATILSALPHFKTDAILRRDNVDRYDDREIVQTNLIDSYDRLLNFGEKHLNDPFYLENDQRISLRSHILREVVSNLLIHREYANPFPAKLVIDRENFYTENSNKPHGMGLINPTQFSPCPKNPSIARIFREIGRADELGSGVRKLFRFCKEYCGQDPQLIENDIFKFILPLRKQVAMQVTGGATGGATGEATGEAARTVKILKFCETEKSAQEIMELLGLAHREYFRIEILTPLLQQNLLHSTIPEKITSPNQKYYSGTERKTK